LRFLLPIFLRRRGLDMSLLLSSVGYIIVTLIFRPANEFPSSKAARHLLIIYFELGTALILTEVAQCLSSMLEMCFSNHHIVGS
jgi:hypothetical protein